MEAVLPGDPPAFVARTGLPELDEPLGGLYRGDNVVWELGAGASAGPFLRAASRDADTYDFAAYVSLATPPGEVEAEHPRLRIVHAHPGSPLGSPGPLLDELGRRCQASTRNLVIFDPLDTMVARWGSQATRRFFGACCPRLLELGVIAHWTLDADADPQLRRHVDEVTQCVVSVTRDRVRIAKAQGRPPGAEGAVFRYRVDDGIPVLEAAPASGRLGAGLRAARRARGLSQSDLARLAGVSPSAISQAERGRRGLSLETLVELSNRLGLSLDELVRGDRSPGFRVGRLRDEPRDARGQPFALLDDPGAGLRTYLARLAPGGSGRPHLGHKHVELVAVGRGLVQVVTSGGPAVVREGEVVLADEAVVERWRNLGEIDALLFWIVRD
jgi:transcriptional regulator with XRE-family HTH domain